MRLKNLAGAQRSRDEITSAVSDIDLTSQQVFAARQIRDAELSKPGCSQSVDDGQTGSVIKTGPLSSPQKERGPDPKPQGPQCPPRSGPFLRQFATDK